MLERLARATTRNAKTVLVVTGLLFVVAAALGGGVARHLSSGGFDDPDAASSRAGRLLEARFGAGEPNLVLLVTAPAGVDAGPAAEAGRLLTAELAADQGISTAVSYWTLGDAPPLRSSDATQALVLARIDGDDDAVRDRIEELSPRYTRDGEAIDVRVGGSAEIFRQVGTTIEDDLKRAESIAFPVTLVLLVLVFGSVVAASLPLAIGGLAIVGTFLVLRVIASFTQVSIFSLNMTTAMGLGLAIDYSLFIVSRFREELRAGHEPHEAVVRTVRTAGRTVAFSGLTVAVSLAALFVFPLAFLRSFAYAGIAVVAMAVAGAVIFLPALLSVLGHRVDALRVRRREPKSDQDGFWHRMAIAVMRRPVGIGTAVVVILVALGLPFLHASFGLPDDRVLPEGASGRRVSDEIRTNFTSQEAAALSVVADGVDPASPQIDGYATELSKVDGVARVDAASGSYINGARVLGPTLASARFVAGAATWLAVVPSVEPMSVEGEELVREVREVDAPFEVLVGGPSAQLVDSKASLFGKLPLAGALIGLATFVLLFLMFGSLVVPAKAVVLNLLSLTATFGAMVWVFQDGHLSGLLGFTPTGLLDTTTPILMFCIAFGLSMDYEVFLLSRIKEEHDRGRDNVSSVAFGLERTGRIVTTAAAILAVVFIAFATSGITFIKLFGIGLTLAVLMDATLIRATLVPAFMRLAGDANWWLPAPLRRFQERLAIRESADEVEAAPRVEPVRREIMLTVSASELRTNMPEILERASGGSSFLVTRSGKPMAVLVPFEDVEEPRLGKDTA